MTCESLPGSSMSRGGRGRNVALWRAKKFALHNAGGVTSGGERGFGFLIQSAVAAGELEVSELSNSEVETMSRWSGNRHKREGMDGCVGGSTTTGVCAATSVGGKVQSPLRAPDKNTQILGNICVNFLIL